MIYKPLIKFNHLRAAIFDWAGTVIDHGSLAPMGAFVKAFAQFGVDISIDEARGPMGMAKRPHIAALMALPRIAEAWKASHGRLPEDRDIDAVFDVFLPMNIAAATEHAMLIAGTVETVSKLREGGLKIGTTTGYTHDIMDAILPLAAEQGFMPDSVVCTGDTPAGRPSPFMIYRSLMDMGVWPAAACVKIDDTEVGIAEGLNAGAWTVGVVLSGNVFGLSVSDTARLSPAELASRRESGNARLRGAGAHYVIDSVADLLPVVADIEGRLQRGERP
jgi:phosphonoacetaldehyde hydrolase